MFILAALVLGACDSSAGSTSPEERREGPSASPAAPSHLIYVDHTTLYSYDISNGSRERLAELPSADVDVSPDGRHYVVVEETAEKENPDEFTKPRLQLAEMGGDGEAVDLGPGYMPEWSPDGGEVAAVAKARGYLICPSNKGGTQEGEERGDACRPAERVVAYGAESVASSEKSSRVLLGANLGWSILGWTDGDRVAAIASSQGIRFSLGPGEESAPVVGFPPSEIWGVSPTEFTLLIVQEDRAYFASPGEGVSPALDLDGRRLGGGTWAPTGEKVAAVLVGKGRGSELGVVDVESVDIAIVPDSRGAHGDVIWGPDGSFVYTRVQRDSSDQLEAVICSSEIECEELFSWDEDVSLLTLLSN
jgi:Tol biopolymer transport system component